MVHGFVPGPFLVINDCSGPKPINEIVCGIIFQADPGLRLSESDWRLLCLKLTSLIKPYRPAPAAPKLGLAKIVTSD
ncbi:hypothetical protein DSO57_1037860 [Entomophthora muscae]|uniref:Uncharacterized protein n=1 Tax=Entomophthora muscae TaxID=34485 RepID=A0ACC2RDM0_9FUNG|nr:hypothetical protein DSO57_1037860 [Entomophthora muscae]